MSEEFSRAEKRHLELLCEDFGIECLISVDGEEEEYGGGDQKEDEEDEEDLLELGSFMLRELLRPRARSEDGSYQEHQRRRNQLDTEQHEK